MLEFIDRINNHLLLLLLPLHYCLIRFMLLGIIDDGGYENGDYVATTTMLVDCT